MNPTTLPPRHSINTGRILFIIALLAALGITSIILFRGNGVASLPDLLTNFKALFISIILEALPFMLFGVLFSSILEVFVSEATVRRLIPRNPLLAVLFSCVLGFIFPICECGLTPVVRRLIHKGMPLYTAIVFILAGPIVNPVVFAATYMAFRTEPHLAYYRLLLAVIVASAIGLFIWRVVKTDPLRPAPSGVSGQANTGSLTAVRKLPVRVHPGAVIGQTSRFVLSRVRSTRRGVIRGRISSSLSHAIEEFFEMGKYLLLGGAITALIQCLFSRDSLMALGGGPLSSHIFMMGMAYLLSLCSTSDAFVASSFASTFPAGALLTFMIFGPMLDLKGTIMLLSVFKAKFVLLLAVLIIVTVFIVALIAGQTLPMS
ncbi:putative permease [compost metagenome]